MPHILVAEDDADDRVCMERAIRRWSAPHHVVLVDNTDDAADRLLGEAGGEPFDLVVVDHSLFPSGAVPLLRRLRAAPKLATVPIVVVSGEVSGALVSRCLQAGASSVLRKPVETEPFRQMVCMMLDYWLTCDEGGKGTGRIRT